MVVGVSGLAFVSDEKVLLAGRPLVYCISIFELEGEVFLGDRFAFFAVSYVVFHAFATNLPRQKRTVCALFSGVLFPPIYIDVIVFF